MINNDDAGKIVTMGFIVHCAVCGNREVSTPGIHSKKDAAYQFKNDFLWLKVIGKGWVCPDCKSLALKEVSTDEKRPVFNGRGRNAVVKFER